MSKKQIMREISRLTSKAVEYEVLGRNSIPIWDRIEELRNDLRNLFDAEGSTKREHIETRNGYTYQRFGRVQVMTFEPKGARA